MVERVSLRRWRGKVDLDLESGSVPRRLPEPEDKNQGEQKNGVSGDNSHRAPVQRHRQFSQNL
jgi:hypothetical protein